MQPGEAPEHSGRIELAPGVFVDESALDFTYASSSGPGGQNVNRRATKAILRVDPGDIPLGESARRRLLEKGARWLTGSGELIITCDSGRSQTQNKRECLQRLRLLIIEAKKIPKPRRATKTPRWAKAKRVEEKRRRGEVKKKRKDPEP